MKGFGVMVCSSDELDLIGGYENPRWADLSDSDIQDKCEEMGVYENCTDSYMHASMLYSAKDTFELRKGYYFALVEADDETRYIGVKLFKEGKKKNETI